MNAERQLIHRRVSELLRIRHERMLEHATWKTKNIEVGDFTYGIPTVRTWGENAKLHIGKFCSIADGVQIFLGGEHHTEWMTTYPFDVLVDGAVTKTKGDVWIGNDVWIGQDAKIMSGSYIGDGAVIGAGAVVTRYVSSYTVVGGVPARRLHDRVLPGVALRLMELAWWDWSVEKIAEAMPMLMSEDAFKLAAFSEEYDRRQEDGRY